MVAASPHQSGRDISAANAWHRRTGISGIRSPFAVTYF
jgi:hypothetical protein